MKISQIKIENFKSFQGEHVLDIDKNLVFLVGENNTGKSNIFEAIQFIKAGLGTGRKVKDVKNKAASASDQLRCTVKLVGNIKEVINDFSEDKYIKYVFEENGIETLLIQRSSEEREIQQGNRKTKIDIGDVTLWNQETQQYENPSGVDKVIGSLFESQFVWADTDPSEVADMGTTKICGRLLGGAIGDFFVSDQWKKFQEVHEETFHGASDSLSMRSAGVEAEIKTILRNQYGDVSLKFNFALPEPTAFYKAGQINVNDGTETDLAEKGTGLQRAVALAIIQVYAKNQATHKTDAEKAKPLFFFIDEPELCLHPRAQQQLMEALHTLSTARQIFLTTHSPYLLKFFKVDQHDLFVCRKDQQGSHAEPVKVMGLFKWSPSWGEINYYAYGIPTLEFHDELYGSLHERYISSALDQADAKIKSTIENFDLVVLAKNDPTLQTYQWSPLKNGIQQPAYGVTLTTFVRHKMHHPESQQATECSEKDLKDSIDYLISLI